ncbi:hypothetical protein F5X99DRAFT_381871 [Biscogniauxia marginata]|nr:hypothetical protein F5X99DRAFT_381871 [Biscogniauxia marginata]
MRKLAVRRVVIGAHHLFVNFLSLFLSLPDSEWLENDYRKESYGHSQLKARNIDRGGGQDLRAHVGGGCVAGIKFPGTHSNCM